MAGGRPIAGVAAPELSEEVRFPEVEGELEKEQTLAEGPKPSLGRLLRPKWILQPLILGSCFHF
jgi:hypothetical protein